MHGIRDHVAVLPCRTMFGHDHVLDVDHDLILATADEHAPARVLGRQGVLAPVEADEAIEPGLAWTLFAELVAADAVERRQSFLMPEIQRSALCRCMEAGVGGMRKPDGPAR